MVGAGSYKRYDRGGRNVDVSLSGTPPGRGLPAAAATREIYSSINNEALMKQKNAAQQFLPNPDEFIGTNAEQRYASPSPEEYIGIDEAPIHPTESPNRGGFNQAEGVSGPDYSEGDELRAQARKLQNPSWWKKMVNGDMGLAVQAEHKLRLAEYADLTAERKHRWSTPGAYKKDEKLEHVRGGLWNADKKAWEVWPAQEKPDKPEKPEPVHQYSEGGKLWGRRASSTTAEPITKDVPDSVGPMPNGPPGSLTRPMQQDAPEKEFAKKPKQRDLVQDAEGNTYSSVFDPETGQSEERKLGGIPRRSTTGKGKGSAGTWTPEELAALSGRIGNIRKAARVSMDPGELDAAEELVKSILASAGLEEDPKTGGLRPIAATQPGAGHEPFDPKNPIPGTTRTDRKTGKREIFLRGAWQPYAGTKKSGTK